MNREDSAKVGGWLDHASRMARAVAEHGAAAAITAITEERDNALAALRRCSAHRGQLDARCEQLFIEREQLRAAVSSVRAMVEQMTKSVDWRISEVVGREILAALDSTDVAQRGAEGAPITEKERADG